jgi:hypothetical protein
MDSPNFSNQQQDRISDRLKELVSPGSAAFWRDACRLMETEPPLKSTTHLVGHLLREIESSLRDVLMPISKQSEPLEPSKQGAKKKNLSGDEKHKAEIDAVLKVLEIPETSAVAQTWLSLPGKDNEYGLAKRAHRKALDQPRPIDSEFREFWNKMQAVLDGVLDRFEAKYAKVFCLLDELAAKPEPTDQDLKALCNSIPNSFVTRRYLFERLKFPGWLSKLQEKGFFKNPPEPEIDAERGLIRFLPWPQSGYLVRMAPQKPAIVLDIALKILETGTKNASVHEDLAEAARSMPPELAARWVEKETEWLKEQDYLYLPDLPEKLGKLIAYLAQRGQVNTALGLARELLAVLPKSQNNDDLALKPRTRCDDYYYEQILTQDVPTLVASAGEATLDLLCNLLNDAINFWQYPPEDGVREDHSNCWYPTFEENPHNLFYEPRVFLSTAVWKTAQQIARNDPAKVSCLAEKLKNYHWRIFHRIALHLLYSPESPEPVKDNQLCQEPVRDDQLCQERPTSPWWEGYVTVTSREEYNHAVERIGVTTPKCQNPSSANQAWVVRLVHFYWCGELNLGDSDRLLERFFANAPTQNREEFMKGIGWQLRYGNSEVGTDLLGRLQRLWEWRISEVDSTEANNSQASELRFFSWWFASRKFDDNWSMTQLINALRLAKALEYDKDLLCHLVALAPSIPLDTVECLTLMAEANGIPHYDWFASYRQEDHRAILSAVLQSEDQQACKAAKELINRLLFRGIDFQDLLSDGEG